MLSNNHNNSSCAFAEQMISYLYSEAAANEKNEFEAHLKSCSVCANELESFNFTRSSILEWRDEEFSRLETPVFNIPASGQEKHFSASAISTETISWTDKFRRLFSFNPAFAAGALGVFIVAIGLILFLSNASNKTDIADAKNELDKNLAQASVSPTAEIIKSTEQTSVAAADSKKSSSSAPETADETRKSNSGKQILVNETIVKVSNNTPKNATENSVSNSKETKSNLNKTPSVKKSIVPKLSDIDEDEDDSIRLADLFAELDIR